MGLVRSVAKQDAASFAREFAGSFGDLGTLLPLTLGLIIYNGLEPVLVFALLGATYVFAGLYYRLPVPVQPLKATAALAIATGASASEIRAAALTIAAMVAILGVTGLADSLSRVFPRLLVRGLQFGLGLLMIRNGVRLFAHFGDGVSAAISGFPSAGAGHFPGAVEFQVALFALVIPQIPLTIGNSIVATRDCALNYFGADGERVTAGSLASTIALGNLAAGLLGGVPICHGAGGLTAHYRFGAKTAIATVMLGTMFLAVAFGARGSLAAISMIPAPVLGALLLYVGIRHAGLARQDFSAAATAAVVLTMGAISYFNGNLCIALAAGMVMKLVLVDVPYRRQNPKEEAVETQPY